PKEVLLSDDPPDARATQELKVLLAEDRGIRYPEWDYREQAYTAHATVRLLTSQTGGQRWVEETLEAYRSMLNPIRRQFEMLRSQRVWQRRQLDGDEIDLDAYTESYADSRAGAAMAEAIYQQRHNAATSLAITLLI